MIIKRILECKKWFNMGWGYHWWQISLWFKNRHVYMTLHIQILIQWTKTPNDKYTLELPRRSGWLILPIKYLCPSWILFCVRLVHITGDLWFLSIWIVLKLFIHLQQIDCLGFSQHKIHLGWFLWIGLLKHRLVLLVALKCLLVLLITMLFFV